MNAAGYKLLSVLTRRLRTGPYADTMELRLRMLKLAIYFSHLTDEQEAEVMFRSPRVLYFAPPISYALDLLALISEVTGG
jgi:hypothetical protein